MNHCHRQMGDDIPAQTQVLSAVRELPNGHPHLLLFI
jgi:hypothetical protein